MKVYKSQSEVEKDIKDGVLAIDGDVKFECDIDINAHINARDINARNINARDINARDINARDINARDINAGDINAGDINAWNINAWDISYYAFCCAYGSIKCKSWKSRRYSAHDPICIDGELTIADEEMIEIDGKKWSKDTIKEALKNHAN